jgi:phage baseplate assembly protein W
MARESIGVNYPIQRSNDGYFDKTFTTIEHTKANIINVLSTKRGERIGRPNVGTNLESLLFEPMSQQLEADIRSEIESAIEQFIPYVRITDLAVKRDEEKQVASVELTFTTVFLPGDKEENVQLFFELTDQPS